MTTLALNLDPYFKPTYLKEIEHSLMQFKGGESHIKLNGEYDFSNIDKVVITNRFVNGDDIMEALITKDALNLVGIKDVELIMPYIPYARQDRKCDEGESFTLKVFTNLINSANFSKVTVIDAHSDVALALLNNCVNIPNFEYVNKMLNSIFS
jgi:ribose-phosphate pyrophosphokinase